MPHLVHFQTQLTFRQVAELARQLSPADKARLARLLAKETAPEAVSAESKLTPEQRKTWKGIKKGFEELELIKEGKLKTISSDEFLKELKTEGYL